MGLFLQILSLKNIVPQQYAPVPAAKKPSCLLRWCVSCGKSLVGLLVENTFPFDVKRESTTVSRIFVNFFELVGVEFASLCAEVTRSRRRRVYKNRPGRCDQP